MAVTKQTYTAAPAWTAEQAADLLKNAFIDADLMVDWYDSFVNGAIQHRVLEVVYDNTKTYGTTYYWFTITTATIRVSVASGWNNTTNVPTGTQYLDFYSTLTNTVANHIIFSGTLSTGTQLDVVRYTSALNPSVSWFVLRNGSTPFPFFIAPPSTILANWLDLDRVLFHHFVTSDVGVSSTTSVGYGYASFRSNYLLRRSFCTGGSLVDRTIVGSYADFVPLGSYTAPGNFSNQAGNYQSAAYILGSTIRSTTTIAPYGFTNTNPEYTTNYTPVMFGYSLSPYIRTDMPNDMAIHFAYTTTAISYGDRIVVSAGIEEWEVLNFANTTISTTAAPVLLARVI
jgi:hypothetical protein